MDHTVLPAKLPTARLPQMERAILPLLRKHSPNGATPTEVADI